MTIQHISLDQPDHTVGLYKGVHDIDNKAFKELWDTHPDHYHTVKMWGKEVLTPRWQEAQGKSYSYSQTVNKAKPIHPLTKPYLEWGQANIAKRLNGLLINWYDPAHKHYIGKHHDSTKGLQDQSPIVTISLGERRIFRIRRSKKHDIILENGDVLVMPWDINELYTHEVPHFARYTDKRISITLRAFK